MNKNTPDLKSTETEIDLIRMLGCCADNKKTIISITFLFLLIATIYAWSASPVYQSDAMIQVEQKQGNTILSHLSQKLQGSSPEVSPEIQLLQSRMILGKTINDLNLRNIWVQKFFPVFGKHWARLTGEDKGNIVIGWLSVPPSYKSKGDLILTVGQNEHYQVKGEDFTVSGIVGRLLDKNGFSIKVTDINAKPGTQFMIMQLTEREAINNLLSRYVVSELGKDSGMLYLTISGEDPDQNTLILNNIADNYLQQNIARQAAQDSKSLAFLKKQLPLVRNELDVAENKLNNYRQLRDSIDLNLEAKSVLDQIVNVENQLNEATFREAEISQLYKKDHPTYRALIEKRQTLELEKVRLNKRVSEMPSTQQEILRLSRDVESGRAIYQQLLIRQQELSIAQSSAVGNVRVIDPAVAQPFSVKPKKSLIVVMGGMLGLMISTGLVLMRELIRRGIELPEQLEELGISVYATVPVSGWLAGATPGYVKNKLSSRICSQSKKIPYLALDNPADISIEAIRGLRTSLHFAMMESLNNCVMITSATPGSGKTFVSSNLAAIVAQAEHKALIIDADMRRGYVHELFGIKNVAGLADVLSGNHAISDTVQPYTRGGFDVITRGKLTSNPAELLMSERFNQLLEWANKSYDIVIIDTPPVLPVTDAAIIGRSAGTSLVVARYGKDSVQDIAVSIQRLEYGGGTVKGAILNGVVKRSLSTCGYYHYDYK
ncbi:polysaccharide biosynthesis tyrosine autokinase [uncultured Enterobacter sp.]|uniref:polysaccharide biosynthesis tyrosine autokinase n=1 Tax=uncultured Enterobacter sp. TaxID=238202 RepID=UPI0025CBDC99|nr:polysaccharide biosynthesis tyrosine autokinase [uncultured Enterobacter sp.]